VGITHCCDKIDLPSSVVVVTEDKIHAVSNSQGDIHAKVVENGKRAEEVVGNEACLRNTDEIPTLYPIDKKSLKTVSPTLIITQDLCHVCAPSSQTVFRALKEAGIDAKVVLLTPTNLNDVVTNLQEVADAAGISARGKALCEELTANLNSLQTIVREKRKAGSVPKKVLVMEWVDPPFCGGHWIPDMARLIGTELAIAPTSEGRSRQITWAEIEESDPDVVVVACCGFDLERNLVDAASSSDNFRCLRSHRSGSIFAANGDQYFARPSPKLLIGTVILALCVYSENEEPELVRAILDLPFSFEALKAFRAMKF